MFKKTAVFLAVSSATLMACDGSSAGQVAQAEPTKSIGFSLVSAPSTDSEKRLVRASEKVTVNDKEYDIKFNTILRSGDSPNGSATFGLLFDKAGTALTDDGGDLRVSSDNEFTSLLPIGDRLFSVSQFESSPGAMYLIELEQDSTTGELSAIDLKNIDLAGVEGGWVHCAGSVTPWNTHLASEEYEPNARDVTNHWNYSYHYQNMDNYLGTPGDESGIKPYAYGWNVEVKVEVDGSGNASATPVKHYAMGRMAFELSYVMPDQKTVYMTDDGTNVGLYMFVADAAGDLSTGTIYAAKWVQTSAAGVGTADLEWISLGQASNSDISIDTAFADIFETENPAADGSCPTAGFTSINTTNGNECLKLKAGKEKEASRLETRRYAAMLGATTEFRKEEGVTYDPDSNKLYVAMSEVARGMENFMKNGAASNSYDLGGYNHIKLDGFNRCGAVYQLDLAANTTIGSSYVAQNMSELIAGIPAKASYGSDNVTANDAVFADKNSCHIDGIANPDNVTYLPGYNTLIIGEDTGSGHQNDAIWSYNTKTKELARILTTPYGAETTSPYWYPDINGWAYLMTVVQHPYGESDSDKLATGSTDNRAYTGYVGPFPALK